MPEPAPGTGWAINPIAEQPRSVVASIRAGILDAGLAATLWQLIGARVPVIVAATDPGAEAEALLGGLLEFAPPTVRRVALRGSDETFDWLPQATDLGWPGAARSGDGDPVRPDTTTLVAREFSDRLPVCTWGEAPGSPSARRPSDTAWRRRCAPIRSTTCSRRSSVRRSR